VLVFKDEDVVRLAMEFRQLREGLRASLPEDEVEGVGLPSLLLDEFALEVYGVSAEFNILTANTTEMVKSLSGLMDHLTAVDFDELMAREKAAGGSSASKSVIYGTRYLLTFFAYYLLYHVCAGHDSGDTLKLLMTVAAIHPSVVGSEELRFPIEVKKTLDQGNYVRFFSLRSEANPYQRALLDTTVARVRRQAMSSISIAYHQFPLDDLTRILDFLSLTDCLEYLKTTAGIPEDSLDLKEYVVYFRKRRK